MFVPTHSTIVPSHDPSVLRLSTFYYKIILQILYNYHNLCVLYCLCYVYDLSLCLHFIKSASKKYPKVVYYFWLHFWNVSNRLFIVLFFTTELPFLYVCDLPFVSRRGHRISSKFLLLSLSTSLCVCIRLFVCLPYTIEQQKATVKTLDTAKPKQGKVSAAPKYEELPEIPDYERPPLEKFEKPEFTKVSTATKSICLISLINLQFS